MFLLNPDRYVVADPAILFTEATFKRLWGSATRFGSLVLESSAGPVLALPTGGNGEFETSLGRSIATGTAHIAFAPYTTAEKLLPQSVIRLSLKKPALLFLGKAGIILDGRLTIFCACS